MDLYADLPDKPTKDAAISLANHLLQEFRIPTRIEEPQDISSSLFVVLYESLFSDRLPGIIRQPASKDDEIHNCQIVIDVLSNDVIHDSLSHIRGVDIVAGDLTAIFNLLDIFSHLLEYVMNRIESDQDDSRSVGSVEPGAEMAHLAKKNVSTCSRRTPNVKVQSHRNTDSRSKREDKMAATFGSQRAASLNKNENRKAYDDHRIISHEEFYAMTYGGLPTHRTIQPLSPIRYDQSQSLLGQKTIDSEFDHDTEKIDKVFDPLSYHPKIAWDANPVTSSDGQGVSNAAVTTASSLDKDEPPATATATTAFSVSMPPPDRPVPDTKPNPLRSTVESFSNQTCSIQEDVRANRAPVSMPSYYQDLKQLVKRTAVMAKQAVDTSPIRKNAEKDVGLNVMDEPCPSLSSEGVRLAQELNAAKMSPSSKTDQYPGGKKKVAFVTSQGETKLGPGSINGNKASTVKCMTEHGGSLKCDAQDNNYCDQWVSDESDPDVDNICRNQYSRWHHTARSKVSHDLPADQTYQKPKTLTGQNNAFARHLVLNRQPEMGTAHMALKNEDLAIRKKHELLRKFYEKDHEEFTEDVEYMLGRHLEKAAETEEQYLQKCAEATIKKKGVQKLKGSSMKPTRKKKKQKSARHRLSAGDRKLSSPPLALENEEDLLPFLLDEFPYLHLTEHTWHELWRKGLHQVEALTRAYQEIEQRKSRAQNQLAEAAERHSLLSDIMRKQLDHSRRMQEIKEQKQQQIQMRNKTHEKRMQSARARRYYNEYQVRARAKMLKRRTKEEMIFRDLFRDTLKIQRERIKDIHRYASDQRHCQEQQRQNEIDSLENYYHDQFEMLAERLARERFETEIRDVAQKQMLNRMKKELQKKMEAEIKQYQDQMFCSQNTAFFRHADAERLKQYFHTARHSVRI